MEALAVLRDVREACVHPPTETTIHHLMLQMIAVLLFTLLFRAFHYTILAPIKTEAQYFALHTWVNGMIVVISIPYTLQLLQDPSRGMFCDTEKGCANQLPNVLTTALHLYHMWMFTMKPIDLIHHIPAFIAAFFNMMYPTGPIQNFTFLFIMGIPGGYDYALLVGIKHGYLGKMVEKRANSKLNLWLRSPGLIVSSFSIYQSLMTHPHEFMSYYHMGGAALVMVHNLWNAQYFMNRAIQSEAIHAVMLDRQSPTRWMSAQPITVNEDTANEDTANDEAAEPTASAKKDL